MQPHGDEIARPSKAVGDEEQPAMVLPPAGDLNALLFYYEARRRQLLIDLRYIERVLVHHGRLKRGLLPEDKGGGM